MAIVDLYPTSLRLLGRPVLVVGGGTVAARRAKALLDAMRSGAPGAWLRVLIHWSSPHTYVSGCGTTLALDGGHSLWRAIGSAFSTYAPTAEVTPNL